MQSPFLIDPEATSSVLADHPNVLALTIVVPLNEGVTAEKFMGLLSSFLNSLPPYTSTPVKPHVRDRARFAQFLARRQLQQNRTSAELFDTLASIDWSNDRGCKNVAWMVLKPPPPDPGKSQIWKDHYAHGIADAAELAMLSRAEARQLCEHPRSNMIGQETKRGQAVFERLEKWLLRIAGIGFLD